MFRLYVVFHGSPCKSKVITLFTKNSIVAHFLTLLFFSIFAIHDEARFCTIPFDFKVDSIEMLPHLSFVVMCVGTSRTLVRCSGMFYKLVLSHRFLFSCFVITFLAFILRV